MLLSEDQLGNWSQPPSGTRDARSTNAVEQVRDVLLGHFGETLNLVRHGSHRNRTNIRPDSDADLAVVHTQYYFADTLSLSQVEADAHEAKLTTGTYSYAQFKNEVEDTLRKAFGDAAVERKNKCIRLTGDATRCPLNIVPAFSHYRYSPHNTISATGIELVADDGEHINNFPEQHYQNGVLKNERTSRAFKSIVRILKWVRQRLVDEEVIGEEAMPSFFLECLIWNVPNDHFGAFTWKQTADAVTAKIWNDMRDPEIAAEYSEMSDLRWLFRGNPQRSYRQAEDFMLHAQHLLTQ